MNEKLGMYDTKKYSILYYLNTKLSIEVRIKAMKDLPQLIDVSASQFHRYLYAKKGEVIEARPSYLQKIACYLSGATGETITVDDLLI